MIPNKLTVKSAVVSLSMACCAMAGFGACAVPEDSTSPDDESTASAPESIIIIDPGILSCITVQRGSSYGDVEDALLVPGYPTYNFGAAERISVTGLLGGDCSGSNIKSLVKFKINAGAIPAGAVVKSAQAYFRPIEPNGDSSLSVYRVTSDWQESTVTKNNSPSGGYATPAIRNPATSDLDTLKVDLTQQVIDWVSGAVPDYGIMIGVGPSASYSEFSFGVGSSESEKTPYLNICYQPSACSGKADGTACDDAYRCVSNGTCQSGVCQGGQAAAAGTVCRPAAGPCDVAETCDGTNKKCPTAAIAAGGVVCRAAAGPCDAVETCDGASFVGAPRQSVARPRVGRRLDCRRMAIALSPAPADLVTLPTEHVLGRWLAGLRWAVFAVLAATLPLDATLFGFHVLWAVAVPVLAVVVAVSAAWHRRIQAGREISGRALAFGAAFDLVAIGAVLAASGGAANPFSAVFVVHVALAASLLPARTTFALAGLAACLFGALFALPSGGCCPNHPANGAFSTHLYGMWFAFVVAAGLVSYFLTRVRGALDAREREIARLRRQADEGARFAALGTLAAGTAHELATPLGTIAVLAGEVASGAEPADRGGATIAAQVARCREILGRMQGGAGAARAGSATVGAVVRGAVEAWRRAHPDVDVRLTERAPGGAALPLGAEDAEAALCALLDNAHHATGGSGEAITVGTEVVGGGVCLVVEDAGIGVDPALRGRLGEPFLTTKEPGQGMGLGLYWIRTILERIGGDLSIEPRAPRGTRVVLRFAPGCAA